jgi:hypothetical protein
MTWMEQETCPVCGAGEFEPDCDEVDIGVGVQEGNHRGLCRVCGEIFPKAGEPGFDVRCPLEPGDLVSIDVTWPNGRTVRMEGRYVSTAAGEVYVESDLGAVVGPAESMERVVR